MKNTIKLLLLCLLSVVYVGCSIDMSDKTNLRGKKITVRLTTYSKDERLPKHHPDKWSKKGISSTGIPLQNMQSVAVDPKIIPYFSKIKLSCLNFIVSAIDTGSWVKSKRAAIKMGRNCPVIDLFFNKERDAADFRRRTPLFVEALILN